MTIQLDARYTYFVDQAAPLSAEERERLELLLSGDNAAPIAEGAVPTLFVVPRPGTISPWSSKATDIARRLRPSNVSIVSSAVFVTA